MERWSTIGREGLITIREGGRVDESTREKCRVQSSARDVFFFIGGV